MRSNYKDRKDIRLALKSVEDTDDYVYLKDYLITFCSQKSEYATDLLRRDIRHFNRVLNKKIFKKHFQRNPNRIVFYCFFEKSTKKVLSHCHMLLRIPRKFMKFIDQFILYIQSIFSSIKHFVNYQLDFKRKDYDVINYITKHYRSNSTDFDVF